MYKEAARMKLRFATDKGPLTVEQLWSLSQKDLANSITTLNEHMRKSDVQGLDFLSDEKKPDTENQLRFEILKDVYLTKKKEAEDLKREIERKENNQKILDLIKRKEDGLLEGKSIEELKAMLA